MMPGPDQVVACPMCGGLAHHITLFSGNTLGARIWTDGKEIAPMMPSPPAIVKCHHCEECYWLAEAEKVGTFNWWEDNDEQVNPDWLKAKAVQEPTEVEYFRALERGLARNSDEERTLRVLAWWRRNDAFRDHLETDAGGIESTPETWRKNLEALAHILDEEDENDSLMKAEVLRELGEFELARQILGRVNSSEAARIVRELRSLCDNGDMSVRELRFNT